MTATRLQAQSRRFRSEPTARPFRPPAKLLDIEPDLVRFLSEEQRAVAERFALPVVVAEIDDDVERLLEGRGAFGALVLAGLLVQAVSVDTQTTLRLIGPGGIAPIARQPRSIPSLAARLVAAARTELVLLAEEFLLASHRWPWLVASLHARMTEQSERLMTQLAISQLPRVEDRLMAMMWLLADGWGHVTPAGIRLDLALSHETLGGLIGARRPTVTLALNKLAQRNALIRQNQKWLILERSPARGASVPQLPYAVHESDRSDRTSPWTAREATKTHGDRSRVSVADAARIYADSAHSRERAQNLCASAAELRERTAELGRIRDEARRSRSASRRTPASRRTTSPHRTAPASPG